MFSVIVGVMLGDGYLSRPNRGGKPRLTIRHTVKHLEYVEHLAERLAPILSGNIKRHTNGGWGGDLLSFSTRCCEELEPFHSAFLRDGRRCVPEEITEWLTPEAMAYWHMDDGDRSTHVIRISTHRYALEDCERLRAALLLHGIGAKLAEDKRHPGSYVIRLNRAHAAAFSDIVRPFVVPCMAYKLVAPMEPVHCIVCGDLYALPPTGRPGCCSDACRKKNRKDAGRRYYLLNREDVIERQRVRMQDLALRQRANELKRASRAFMR